MSLCKIGATLAITHQSCAVERIFRLEIAGCFLASGVMAMGSSFMKARTRPNHQSLSADGKKPPKNRSAGECRIRNCQFKQDSVREREGRRIVTLLFLDAFSLLSLLLFPC